VRHVRGCKVDLAIKLSEVFPARTHEVTLITRNRHIHYHALRANYRCFIAELQGSGFPIWAKCVRRRNPVSGHVLRSAIALERLGRTGLGLSLILSGKILRRKGNLKCEIKRLTGAVAESPQKRQIFGGEVRESEVRGEAAPLKSINYSASALHACLLVSTRMLLHDALNSSWSWLAAHTAILQLDFDHPILTYGLITLKWVFVPLIIVNWRSFPLLYHSQCIYVSLPLPDNFTQLLVTSPRFQPYCKIRTLQIRIPMDVSWETEVVD
jgi:hypothetical protein